MNEMGKIKNIILSWEHLLLGGQHTSVGLPPTFEHLLISGNHVLVLM
jgi:hypothetical protein